MLLNRPLPQILLGVLLSIALMIAGCDSVALEPDSSDSSSPVAEEKGLFQATNDLGSRITTQDAAVTLQPIASAGAGPSHTTQSSDASAGAEVSLTTVAQVDPPGDTTRASHLMFDNASGRLYVGYKALGPDFKGGIDILNANDPTNILDVNSLRADNLDVQEVTFSRSANALFVGGAASPSTVEQDIGGTPALLAKVTPSATPETELAPLPDHVGKSVVNAPASDSEHDVYVATDEETVVRFDADLDNELTQSLQGSELRSVAATGSNVLALDRQASVFKSGVGSANPFTELKTVASGVGQAGIGRLHARDGSALNGRRLFVALGSKGFAVLDATSGDVLFRTDARHYTSVTLHEDDPDVVDEPLNAVYAARPNGIIDVFQIGENGIDTGDSSTGLVAVGAFELSQLDGVDVGPSPQVNQVMGVGCNVFVANSNEGLVTLQIDGGEPCSFDSNTAPTAQDDADQTTESQSITTDVLTNDSDPDGSLDPSTVQVEGGPSDGSVSVDASTGAITYTPDDGFIGDDSYTYTVKDDAGAVSNEATVRISVDRCSNPNANRDLTGSISGGTGTVENGSSDCSYDVGLAVYKKFDGNIPPGQNITQILNDAATDRIRPDETVDLTVARPSCDYQIDLFHGPVIESFGPGEAYGSRKLDFGQVDNGGLCGPTAVDDDADTDEDAPVTVNVAANDTDGDGNLDPTSVTITSEPTDGTVSVNGDGTVTYTPDAGFEGEDSFVYDICDADNRCASLIDEEGTVTVTVES